MSHGADTYLLADEPIEINAGRPTATLTVANTGDRAIQVGSHFHFFEATARCASTAPSPSGCGSISPPGPPSASSPANRKMCH